MKEELDFLKEKASNIVLVKNTDQVKAVQINPVSFSWRIFSGGAPTNAILSFNTNYYWKGVPIGVISCKDSKVNSVIYADSKRPIFVLNQNKVPDIVYCLPKDVILATQAGPTLLIDGEYKPERLKIESLNQTDSVRKTKHIAIGITKSNKVIVAYFHYAGMKEMADELSLLGCTKAFKLDGGSSCFMHYKDIKIGTKVVCGLYIE